MEPEAVLVTLACQEDKTGRALRMMRESDLLVHQVPSQLKLPPVDALEIKLNTTPKDHTGITFGCGKFCDVILPNHPSISSHHFSIKFDDCRRLIVQDYSSKGTEVTYSGQGSGLRAGAKWILNDPEAPIVCEITINVANTITFNLAVAHVHLDDPTYILGVEEFSRKCKELGGSLDSKMSKSVIRQTEQSLLATSSSGIWVRSPTGAGTSGNVTRYWNPHNGFQKVVKKPSTDESYDANRWENEASCLKQLDHHHVVRLITYMLPDKYSLPEIHLEYMSGGTLEESSASIPFSRQEIQSILSQCLSALVHVHAQAIVHRDIKPSNILINKRTKAGICVKIADFGEANSDGVKSTMAGDTVYLAPEVLDEDSSCECKPALDIWSLGLTTLRFLDQNLQALNCTNPTLFQNELAKSDDDLVKFLLAHMLVPDSSQRSSASVCFEKLQDLEEFQQVHSSMTCPCLQYVEYASDDEDEEEYASEDEDEEEGGATPRATTPAIGQDSSGPPTPTPSQDLAPIMDSSAPTEGPFQHVATVEGNPTPGEVCSPATPALTRDTSLARSPSTLHEASSPSDSEPVPARKVQKRRAESQYDLREAKRARSWSPSSASDE